MDTLCQVKKKRRSRYRLAGVVTLSLAAIRGDLLGVVENIFTLIHIEHVMSVVNIHVVIVKIVTRLADALFCFLIIYVVVAHSNPLFFIAALLVIYNIYLLGHYHVHVLSGNWEVINWSIASKYNT